MSDPSLRWFISCALAFAAGSIPFGAILARTRGVDIRQHGSKNVGATNVWRVLGWRMGLLCFALDALKGALPVALAGAWTGALGASRMSAADAWWWMGVAACATLGHMFSPFLGFKGGKGVATGMGALLALWPVVTWAALGAIIVFALSAWRTRYVGISSCLAVLTIPFFIALSRITGLVEGQALEGWPFIAATALLGAIVIWKHRGNIARTLAGTEHKIGHRVRVEPEAR